MNVVGSASRASLGGGKDAAVAASAGGAFLNLYRDIPAVELGLDEFEVYALKRLKVLRKLEQLEAHRVPPQQAAAKIDAVIKQQGLTDPAVDAYSHFILRLSYCQTDELRRWFARHECRLFQHRLQALTQAQLAASVRAYVQLAPLPREEADRLRPALLRLHSPAEVAGAALYAVPFAQALDLVAKRRVLLRRGQAYLPGTQLYPVLAARFRAELNRSLALLSHAGAGGAAAAAEEARVRPLLRNLHQCLAEPERAAGADGALVGSGGAPTAADVPGLQGHMPLCMRQIQSGLERDRHLRHWGRLQYGLFLKGAGLSLEEALVFFQRHFTRVTGEQFQKQYAYNIRHYYGKEGKRATYTPYSCARIIVGNPAPAQGEHHGCPYKHSDADYLSRTLQALKIGTPQDRAAILKLKQEGQYQLACLKQFQVQHPQALEKCGSLENVGNHPNAWFRASLEYQRAVSSGGSGGAAAAPSETLAATRGPADVADARDTIAAMEVSPEK